MIKTAGFWFGFVLGLFFFCCGNSSFLSFSQSLKSVIVYPWTLAFGTLYFLLLSTIKRLKSLMLWSTPSFVPVHLSQCWLRSKPEFPSDFDQICVSNMTGRKLVTFRIFRHCIWTKPFGSCRYLIEYFISASQNTQAHAEVPLISGGWRIVLLDMLKWLEAGHGRLSSKARLSW